MSQTRKSTKNIAELANDANAALDFEKIEIKDKNLQNHQNGKVEEDSKFRSLAAFWEDFKLRLEASIQAGRQGLDEVKAFRNVEENEAGDEGEDSARVVKR